MEMNIVTEDILDDLSIFDLISPLVNTSMGDETIVEASLDVVESHDEPLVEALTDDESMVETSLGDIEPMEASTMAFQITNTVTLRVPTGPPKCEFTDSFIDIFEDEALDAHNYFINAWKADSAVEIAKNRKKIIDMVAERNALREPYLKLQSYHREDRETSQVALAAMAVKDVIREPTSLLVNIHFKEHPIRSVRQPVTFLPMIEILPTCTFFTTLKVNHRTEDETALQYYPYFGDDDHEDVVSNVYDHLPDAVIPKAEAEWEVALLDYVLSNLPPYADDILCHPTIQAIMVKTLNLQAPIVSDRIEEFIQCKNEDKEPKVVPPEEFQEYKDFSENARYFFCRCCWKYNCNLHGHDSPPLHLQTIKAMHYRDKKYYDTNIKAEPSSESCSAACWKNGTMEPPHAIDKDPTFLIIVRKSFEICGGNYCLMTPIVGGIACDQLAAYCMEKGMTPQAVRDEVEFRKASKRKSVKFKKRNILCSASRQKAADENKIMHTMYPCRHAGPCTMKCPCVQSRNFCTKYCLCIPEECRNFHRGCNCSTSCRNEKCPCLAASHECDPDICRRCLPGVPRSLGGCYNRDLAHAHKTHKRLLLGKSLIPDAGWGVFNRDVVLKDEFIHEYVGELISHYEAERRGRIQDKKNQSYLFTLEEEYVVDALRKGNKTRFLNHSSTPNCSAKIKCVNGGYTIGFYALHNIPAHSELLFDYKYENGYAGDVVVQKGLLTDWMKDSSMAGHVSILRKGERKRE